MLLLYYYYSKCVVIKITSVCVHQHVIKIELEDRSRRRLIVAVYHTANFDINYLHFFGYSLNTTRT